MSNDTAILVVEDDANLRALLDEELQQQGYHTSLTAGVNEALEQLQKKPYALVVSDLKLPDHNGMQLLQSVRENPNLQSVGFIVITGFGSIEQAVAALKAGADDFLTKPLDLEHFAVSVERVLANYQLRRQLHDYEHLLGHDTESWQGMIGRSAPMQTLRRKIEQVAKSDGTVLITGESGTGKERVAEAIHTCSHRHAQPFIAINCAGIPADLLESELFGHVKGAFSGAQSQRLGLVASANGGTLFLDEIAEMPLAMQAKLLRFLESGEIRPVGADVDQQVNVRVVAATHRRLEQAIQAGEFREDLMYRLDALQIHVPPLRDRGEDILQLAAYFIALSAKHIGVTPPRLASSAVNTIQQHAWPGNVRELANAMEYAVTFCQGKELTAEDLPHRVRHVSSSAEPTLTTLAEVEDRHIRRVLKAVDGNRSRAAEILGIGRKTLYRKIGLAPEQDQPPGA